MRPTGALAVVYIDFQRHFAQTPGFHRSAVDKIVWAIGIDRGPPAHQISQLLPKISIIAAGQSFFGSLRAAIIGILSRLEIIITSPAIVLRSLVEMPGHIIGDSASIKGIGTPLDGIIGQKVDRLRISTDGLLVIAGIHEIVTFMFIGLGLLVEAVKHCPGRARCTQSQSD
ncbi:MAG: hypothetical protein BWY75_01289 [bacterium ADurb.Bin425]|nr:MAG: hypothetical protein BWY75_01289 [bacterium ADurb.Bin425]